MVTYKVTYGWLYGQKLYKPRLDKYKDKSAKGKWYVVITKPDSLRKSKNDKTLRRTTGTSDQRIAEMRVHGIAEKIYKSG